MNRPKHVSSACTMRSTTCRLIANRCGIWQAARRSTAATASAQTRSARFGSDASTETIGFEHSTGSADNFRGPTNRKNTPTMIGICRITNGINNSNDAFRDDIHLIMFLYQNTWKMSSGWPLPVSVKVRWLTAADTEATIATELILSCAQRPHNPRKCHPGHNNQHSRSVHFQRHPTPRAAIGGANQPARRKLQPVNRPLQPG